MVRLNLLFTVFTCFVDRSSAGMLFSFEVTTEGVFIFAAPVQFSFFYPWAGA